MSPGCNVKSGETDLRNHLMAQFFGGWGHNLWFIDINRPSGTFCGFCENTLSNLPFADDFQMMMTTGRQKFLTILFMVFLGTILIYKGWSSEKVNYFQICTKTN